MKTLADQMRTTLTLLENIEQSNDLTKLKQSIINLERKVDTVTERTELNELNWRKGLAGAAAAGAMALGSMGSAHAAPNVDQATAIQCSAVFMAAADLFSDAGDAEMTKRTRDYASDMFTLARSEARTLAKVNPKAGAIAKNTVDRQYDQEYARLKTLSSDQLSSMAVKCFQQLN